MTADDPHRSEKPLYTARYDPDHDHSPSILIVDGLATVADADPLELPPLYSIIDTEAIDALVSRIFLANRHARGEVSFPVLDYWVHIASDGTITITG